MYKWIQTAEEFHYYFCQQTLLIHGQSFHEDVRQHKSHVQYILSVGGKDITDVVIQVNNLFFDWIYHQNTSRDFNILIVYVIEKIEKTLQDWMTFLLQFLEITNINVIKMLKGVTTHLLNRKELFVYYINEVKY